uniref:Uncharacterized protein LOC105067303 n=1 Tax=Camelus bactrianus TaxID=9837 RepID=A0A9W3EMA5_CAMBA
ARAPWGGGALCVCPLAGAGARAEGAAAAAAGTLCPAFPRQPITPPPPSHGRAGPAPPAGTSTDPRRLNPRRDYSELARGVCPLGREAERHNTLLRFSPPSRGCRSPGRERTLADWSALCVEVTERKKRKRADGEARGEGSGAAGPAVRSKYARTEAPGSAQGSRSGARLRDCPPRSSRVRPGGFVQPRRIPTAGRTGRAEPPPGAPSALSPPRRHPAPLGSG